MAIPFAEQDCELVHSLLTRDPVWRLLSPSGQTIRYTTSPTVSTDVEDPS